MTDVDLRRLERSAAQGDAEAVGRLDAERARLGLGWFGERLPPPCEDGSLHVDGADGVRLRRGIYEWVIDGHVRPRRPRDGVIEMVHVTSGAVLCGGACGGAACRRCGGRGVLSVGAFWIARAVVTAAQYDAFLWANPDLRHPPLPSWYWTHVDADDPDPQSRKPPCFDEWPRTNVSRQEAALWCAWAGLALPTTDELRRCSGPEIVDGEGGPRAASAYPWGDEPPGDDTAVIPSGGNDRPRPSIFSTMVADSAEGRVTLRAPERPRGASRFGALDCYGNVGEWTSDDADGKAVALGPSFRDMSQVLTAGASNRRDDVGFRPVLRAP